MTNVNEKITAGFVGFGEINTPREFIDKRCENVIKQIETAGLQLTKTAPVSDDPEGKDAKRAILELSAKNFDVLIICVAGWIPSWAVFSVIEPFKNKPMILLGLSGWQDGDRFVTTADQAGTTALRKPMQDMGYNFKYIVNLMNKDFPFDDVLSYCKAANVAAKLKNIKIGMAGYRDMRLYGTLYDGVSLKGKIGPEIEHFELLELQQIIDKISNDEIKNIANSLRDRWEFKKEPQKNTIENSAKLFLAIRKKLEEKKYDAFSFVDVDGIKKLMGFAPAGALTLLHDELDIPTIPENDSLGSVTQVMVKLLTGQIAAYLEFYEFTENGAIMGVPDYVPSEIVDGKVTVLPNAFGDFGEGLLNVSKLKTGKVTICRLACTDGKYSMHLMTGTAKTPPKWEEAGWAPPAPQLPSLEIVFDGNTHEFIQNVMGQHYIISYGDNSATIKNLCNILGVKII